MKYSLVVTLNYPTFDKDLTFSELSQSQMYEIARVYLNDPEITSAVFVITPIRKEISNEAR